MPADIVYLRLAKGGRGMLRRSSLWDGGDHMLSISGTRYLENYRRFYYRDIQAIVVRRCFRPGSVGVLILLGFAALFSALLAALNLSTVFTRFLPLIVIPIVIVLLYLATKYGCRCYVHTAVGSEEVPAILRTWTLPKVLLRIRDKIIDAQGALPEDLSSFEQTVKLPFDTPVVPDPAADSVVPAAIPPRAGHRGLYAATCLFVLLMANSAFAFWYGESALIPATLTIAKGGFGLINLLESIAAFMALVTLHNVRLLGTLRGLIITILVFLALRLNGVYMLLAGIGVENRAVYETIGMINARHWVGWFDAGLTLAFAIGGLILLAVRWPEYHRGEVSNP